jgi:hypothetical protein
MNTPKLESPAFTIEPGTIVRQPAGSRTSFRFTAPAVRHFPDGGFQASVSMILRDAQGRLIARRSADSGRTAFGNRASWYHEVDNDMLATATQLIYEIEHRFDYRRTIVRGELPALPAEADGSDYFRWLPNLDARLLEDRAVKLDFALWARQSYVDITLSQQPKLVTDSCRTECELDLLDADQNTCFSRSISSSLNYGQPSYDDTSLSMDRRTMRTLKFFELRGRTELRAIVRLDVALA